MMLKLDILELYNLKLNYLIFNFKNNLSRIKIKLLIIIYYNN